MLCNWMWHTYTIVARWMHYVLDEHFIHSTEIWPEFYFDRIEVFVLVTNIETNLEHFLYVWCTNLPLIVHKQEIRICRIGKFWLAQFFRFQHQGSFTLIGKIYFPKLISLTEQKMCRKCIPSKRLNGAQFSLNWKYLSDINRMKKIYLIISDLIAKALNCVISVGQRNKKKYFLRRNTKYKHSERELNDFQSFHSIPIFRIKLSTSFTPFFLSVLIAFDNRIIAHRNSLFFFFFPREFLPPRRNTNLLQWNKSISENLLNKSVCCVHKKMHSPEKPNTV